MAKFGKKLLKKMAHSPVGMALIGKLAALYIRLFLLTAKVRVENEHLPWKFWRENKPVLIAMYHGRLLFLPRVAPKKIPLSALISEHADGQIISATARHFKMNVVQGSSTKGGLSAVRAMLLRADEGHNLFITPDGPKGPRMTVSKGTVEVARMANVPIFPVAVSCKKGRVVKSWDRFMIPKLFDTIVIRWGNPILVGRETDEATRLEIREEVEEVMNSMQMKLDADLHQDVVTPALMEGPLF